jgi:hypothetical protein
VIANLLDGLFRMEMQSQQHYLVMERYVRKTAKHVYAMSIKGRMEAGKFFLPRSKKSFIEPYLLRFRPDADGEDDFVDMLASAGICLDKAVIRPPTPELPPMPVYGDVNTQQSHTFKQEMVRQKKEKEEDEEGDW